MKKSAILLAAFVAVGPILKAQDALSVSLDSTYYSEYIFRGEKIGGKSLQSSVEAAYGDFYAGIWTSLPIQNLNGDDSEVNFYAGYGLALTDNWSLDVGATVYYYSDNFIFTNNDVEFFVGVTGDLAGLDAGVYLYAAPFAYDYYVLEASLGYSFPLEAIGSSLDVSGSIGFFDTRDGAGDYTYFNLGAEVPYALSDNATLTAGVYYTYRDRSVGNRSNDYLYWSLGLSFGF